MVAKKVKGSQIKGRNAISETVEGAGDIYALHIANTVSKTTY